MRAGVVLLAAAAALIWVAVRQLEKHVESCACCQGLIEQPMREGI